MAGSPMVGLKYNNLHRGCGGNERRNGRKPDGGIEMPGNSRFAAQLLSVGMAGSPMVGLK